MPAVRFLVLFLSSLCARLPFCVTLKALLKFYSPVGMSRKLSGKNIRPYLLTTCSTASAGGKTSNITSSGPEQFIKHVALHWG